MASRGIGKTWQWPVLVAAFTALVLSAPGRGEAQGNAPVSLKMGYLPFQDSLPVFMAQDKGFFAAEGLKVELIQFRFGGLAMEALITKQIDTGVSAFIQPAQIATERGLFIKLVHPMLWEGEYKGKVYGSNALMVRKDSPIKRLMDFKGKTIAVGGFGTISYFSVLTLFKKAGLDPRRDITFIELPYPTQTGALEAGKIDGAALVEPFVGFLEEKGFGRAILDPPLLKYRSYYLIFGPEFPVSGLWTHPEVVQKFPGVNRKLARAIAQSIQWMYSNPEESYDIGAKWLKLERKFIQRMVEQGGYWKPYPDGWKDWQTLEAQVKVFEEFGGIKKPLDVKKLVEFP